MKFYYLLPLSIILFSCNDVIGTPELDVSEEEANKVESPFEDIISIADSVLGLSRSSESDYNISFITNNSERDSRSASDVDTVGYILNRPNDNGFVVVGNAATSKPVLAYNESGNFSYTESNDDIVYVNFISKIPDFIDNPKIGIDSAITLPISLEDYYENKTYIYPKLHVHLGQRSPYDKYVIQEHPGCPVGCVAVATAAIMSHTKRYLQNYHGENFNLLDIISAYTPWATGNYSSINLASSLSKDEANDRFAKLVYYIGKDVNMEYNTDESKANRSIAYYLFKQLGFDVYESGLTNYNITNIAWSLMDGYLVYARGSNKNETDGHAWVIDGCKWKNVDITTNNVTSRTDLSDGPKRLITDIYLHCDWGWDGENNGYFNSDVFSVSNYKFQNMQFFSVKREYSLNDLDNIVW